MKKFLIFICIFSLLLVGCDNKTFSLEEKYYSTSEFIELDTETLEKNVNDKESFAVFIYQPLCTASYEFNKVLTEFADDYKINFYKMSYNTMKETFLGEKIKYYPSLVIFREGKVVDYLDADSDEDVDYFKNVNDFKGWFSDYVKIKKSNNNNHSSNSNEEKEYLKNDAIIDDVVYNENKVNIYFFWGDGCPHCKEEFEFFKSIETEYGEYFTLNTFEVWYNEENAELLKSFASKMNDEVTGVPYTIIGNKTFKGFNSTYEKEFLDAIKNQYKNSYDVYFEK